MKKIIGIVFISLMFCNIGFADIRFIEKNKYIKEKGFFNTSIATVCVDNYKFVLVQSYEDQIAITQSFEVAGDSGRPAKC